MKYFIQKSGTCCFVYAVANCAIYLKYRVSIRKFKKACKIAHCQNGSAINRQMVIDFFNIPLEETQDKKEVFESGGIINIMHPIFNGHSFFIFPKKGKLSLINSWLGPDIINIREEEIERFVTKKVGYFWKIKI